MAYHPTINWGWSSQSCHYWHEWWFWVISVIFLLCVTMMRVKPSFLLHSDSRESAPCFFIEAPSAHLRRESRLLPRPEQWTLWHFTRQFTGYLSSLSPSPQILWSAKIMIVCCVSAPTLHFSLTAGNRYNTAGKINVNLLTSKVRQLSIRELR